jgi:hypothetical protein
MTPTQEYLHGRLPQALACWGAQLASGRAWLEIEAEIVRCCRGRVDLLTQLLIEAETVRAVAPRPLCAHRSGSPVRMLAATTGAAS